MNKNSGWYETFFRGYDAALGRFMQVDPLASSFSSSSPYHYAYNNPVLFNDILGDSSQEYSRFERIGPSSSNHWTNDDFYRNMSAEYFVNNHNNMSNGGTWSNGQAHYFGSPSEASAAVTLGFWVDFPYGPGPGDIATQSQRSIFITGSQQGFDQLFKQFRETYYGGTISAIESMNPVFSTENWKFDWGIVYGESNADVNSKNPGGTAPHYRTNTIFVRIHVSAFANPKLLALVLGHELVHARDIGNGNHFTWGNEFPAERDDIMEYHAWEWTLQAEQNPRINTSYGEGAGYRLEQLGPLLPAGFDFNDYNR